MKSRCNSGQAVVEFALVLPIFLLIFLGIIDFGVTFHMWSSLNQQCVQAARAGSKRIHQLVARNVCSSTTHETLANVQAIFWNDRSPLMASESYGKVIFGGVETTDHTVRVSADFTTTMFTPILGSFFGDSGSDGKLTIHAYAEERKE
ncbi:MAG: pilus assembly protein [Candidatus Riflebacteria bacterium]|nr:pilus assembly protein [Candidatus Riflebacteria bacterium]